MGHEYENEDFVLAATAAHRPSEKPSVAEVEAVPATGVAILYGDPVVQIGERWFSVRRGNNGQKAVAEEYKSQIFLVPPGTAWVFVTTQFSRATRKTEVWSARTATETFPREKCLVKGEPERGLFVLPTPPGTKSVVLDFTKMTQLKT